MKQSVTLLLEEAKKKMSGYAALLNYRFMNLSIKAQPEALLSVTVFAGGETVPIEHVALSRNPDKRDDQFEVYPVDRSLLNPLVAGLERAHPEYKMELKEIPGSEDAEGVKDRYILATMPEVDDKRNNELKEAVGNLAAGCDNLLKMTRSFYSDRIKLALDGAPAQDGDEADDALRDLYDRHVEMCKQFRTDKEKEIEDAYKRYKDKNSGKKTDADSDHTAASQANAGMQMTWTTDNE